jgi:hypothetical protein
MDRIGSKMDRFKLASEGKVAKDSPSEEGTSP